MSGILVRCRLTWQPPQASPHLASFYCSPLLTEADLLSLASISWAQPRRFSSLTPVICCILNTFATFHKPPTKNRTLPGRHNQTQSFPCFQHVKDVNWTQLIISRAVQKSSISHQNPMWWCYWARGIMLIENAGNQEEPASHKMGNPHTLL